MTITVACDPSRTSGNQRVSRWELARRIKADREAAWTAWRAAGRPRCPRPVVVSIQVKRGRAMDPARCIVGTEAIRDALFARRLYKDKAVGSPTRGKMIVEPGLMTPDDSEEWITIGQVIQTIGPQWRGREEVVLIIEERKRARATHRAAAGNPNP